MRRRIEVPSDSLDLLLDTICNTFGGILFIAMLVAILTNRTSQQVAPSVPGSESIRALRGLRSELTESNAKLTKLRQAVRQKEDLERQFADPESLGLLNSIRSLDDSTDALLKERVKTLKNVAESQVQLEEAAKELARLAELMAATKERLEQEKQKLRNEAELRSRSSEVPRQHATQKTAMPFFLKAGRLISFARRDGNDQFVQNEAETRIVEEGPDKKYLEPLPQTGITIAQDGSNADQIAERLAGFDKDQHFLSVFVYKDSFEQFETLKNEIIRNGFEYNLVPFPENARVYIGDQTDPVLVQ